MHPARLARRSFLRRTIGAIGGLTTAGRARHTARATRPLNVLIVLADDLGWGDLSCYGRRDDTTPAIDARAAGGVRLVSAYAASCVCTPTRAALLTGRYPQRLGAGVMGPITFRPEGRPDEIIRAGLAPSPPTLASLLRARGYRTALVGKWHLGYPPLFGPRQSGFDEFRGARPPHARTLHWRHRRPEAPQLQDAMRDGPLKYLRLDDREFLYDIERDEAERVDLAGVRPRDVASMRARHDAWFAATVSGSGG